MMEEFVGWPIGCYAQRKVVKFFLHQKMKATSLGKRPLASSKVGGV